MNATAAISLRDNTHTILIAAQLKAIAIHSLRLGNIVASNIKFSISESV